MDQVSGRLVFTGEILKRDGVRYDVVVADMNVFVVCRRITRKGKETGVTSYLSPEIYSNDRALGSLERYGFVPDGEWLDPETPLGIDVSRSRDGDKCCGGNK